MPALKPVTTRSALLTLLLAAEVPSLTTRELIAAASVVGFAEPAVRVALSRMTAAGDVVRDSTRGGTGSPTAFSSGSDGRTRPPAPACTTGTATGRSSS